MKMMKKFLAFVGILAVAGGTVGTAVAVADNGVTQFEAVEPQTVETANKNIYFAPTAGWCNDGVRFALNYFGGTSNGGWYDLTPSENYLLDGRTIYFCPIPEGAETIIFTRMNPNAPENNWDNRYNQSADISIKDLGGVKTLFAPDTSKYDKFDGTWHDFYYEDTNKDIFTLYVERGTGDQKDINLTYNVNIDGNHTFGVKTEYLETLKDGRWFAKFRLNKNVFGVEAEIKGKLWSVDWTSDSKLVLNPGDNAKALKLEYLEGNKLNFALTDNLGIANDNLLPDFLVDLFNGFDACSADVTFGYGSVNTLVSTWNLNNQAELQNATLEDLDTEGNGGYTAADKLATMLHYANLTENTNAKLVTNTDNYIIAAIAVGATAVTLIATLALINKRKHATK